MNNVINTDECYEQKNVIKYKNLKTYPVTPCDIPQSIPVMAVGFLKQAVSNVVFRINKN